MTPSGYQPPRGGCASPSGGETVDAESADIVAGRKPGRTSTGEITIFDSTGVALEDVAAAVMIYERALEVGAGVSLDF